MKAEYAADDVMYLVLCTRRGGAAWPCRSITRSIASPLLMGYGK